MNLDKLELIELGFAEISLINGGDDTSKSGWWYLAYLVGHVAGEFASNGIGGVRDSNGWGAHGP